MYLSWLVKDFKGHVQEEKDLRNRINMNSVPETESILSPLFTGGFSFAVDLFLPLMEFVYRKSWCYIRFRIIIKGTTRERIRL